MAHRNALFYLDRLDNENVNKRFCRFKNIYYHKSDPKKISISNLYELLYLIKNYKMKIELSDLSEYLEQLITNLIDENYSKNKIIYKRVNSNSNYQIIDKLEINKYEAIIKAKLFNELIDYYNQFYYDKDIKKELDEIKQINKEIITNNITIFLLDFNYEEKNIESKDIINIYSDIIYGLIKTNKIDYYNFAYNIINQLDLENIYINEEFYNKLNSILNPENNNIERYIITEKQDFFNQIKINFYYIIIKYLLKDSLYKHNALFTNTKKIILPLLESNELFKVKLNFDFKDKLIYIIRTLCDPLYYSKGIAEEDKDKLKEILKYYKYYLKEPKKQERIIIKNIIKYNLGNYKKYLNDYEKAKKYNSLANIIKYINDIKNKDKPTEKEITEAVKIIENIKNKELNSIIMEDKRILINYFRDEKNREFLLQIFGEAYQYFINCAIIDLLLFESIITFYKDDNISISFGQLKNKINYQEIKNIYEDLTYNKTKNYDKKKIDDFEIFFQFLEKIKNDKNNIENINSFSYIKIKCKKENNESIYCYINKAEIDGRDNFKRVFHVEKKNKIQNLIKVDDLSTLQSSQRIKSYDEIIIKLSNGYYIAKRSNSYCILDNSILEKLQIDLDKIGYISERMKNQKKDIQLIIISKKKLHIIQYSIEKNNLDKMIKDVGEIDNIFELNKNDFIVSKGRKLILLKNIISNALNKKASSEIITNINDFIKDEIQLFDFKTKFNNLEGYIFNHTKNNLILTGNTLLISSCIKDNQNGILIKFKNKEEQFVNTGDFKVICFCAVPGGNQFYAGGGHQNAGKIKLYNIDYINHSVKCNDKFDKEIKGGEITYLLKIENGKLWYFQDKNIYFIEI